MFTPPYFLPDATLFLTLLVIAVGVFLFIRETFSIDVTAILIMTLFIVTGVLAPEEGFAGFTNSATITVACMFVLSYGLFRSGVLDPLIRLLIRMGRRHYLLALVALMLFAALLSAFINDTAVVALLIPAAMRLADRTGVAPGKLLMPLSFAALLGGMCTLIGTSTNILVSGIVEQLGHDPIGMFEFTHAALWLTLAGMAYLLTVGIWMLPGRLGEEGDSRMSFIALIRVRDGSKEAGSTLDASRLVREFGAEVIDIQRHGQELLTQERGLITLAERDVLKVVLDRAQLLELRRSGEYRIITEGGSADAKGVEVFEAVVPKGSRLIGHAIDGHVFRRLLDHGLLGLRRAERNSDLRFVEQRLAAGDILLIAATSARIYRLMNEEDLTVIEEYEEPGVDWRKALLALGVIVGVVGAATAGIAPIVLTAIVGVLALLVTQVLTPEEAYEAVEWKVIFMLAGVLSMGAALEKSGGDQLIADGLHDVLGESSPRIALGVLFLLTSVLTNVMSNNATAALMTPIALQLAKAMQVSERPFIVGVMMAASVAFMTPMGYQTNTMVYVPGRYRFADYLRVGTPLNLLLWVLATWLLPLYFPFR